MTRKNFEHKCGLRPVMCLRVFHADATGTTPSSRLGHASTYSITPTRSAKRTDDLLNDRIFSTFARAARPFGIPWFLRTGRTQAGRTLTWKRTPYISRSRLAVAAGATAATKINCLTLALPTRTTSSGRRSSVSRGEFTAVKERVRFPARSCSCAHGTPPSVQHEGPQLRRFLFHVDCPSLHRRLWEVSALPSV